MYVNSTSGYILLSILSNGHSSIIQAANNIKYKCVVSLLNSAGLKRGELINLKLSDIDSERMVINVIQGKGNKDRLTILSTSVLKDLRIYFKEWNPQIYLFEGMRGGKYSLQSVNQIIKKAAKKAKIKKILQPICYDIFLQYIY